MLALLRVACWSATPVFLFELIDISTEPTRSLCNYLLWRIRRPIWWVAIVVAPSSEILIDSLLIAAAML